MLSVELISTGDVPPDAKESVGTNAAGSEAMKSAVSCGHEASPASSICSAYAPADVGAGGEKSIPFRMSTGLAGVWAPPSRIFSTPDPETLSPGLAPTSACPPSGAPVGDDPFAHAAKRAT